MPCVCARMVCAAGASDSHSGYEGPDRKRRRHHKGATAAAGAAAAAAPINTVCGHIACSEQLFCFVHEMERMKATYRQGRRDEFRVRAATRAICTLELLAKPIVVPEVRRVVRTDCMQSLRSVLLARTVWRACARLCCVGSVEASLYVCGGQAYWCVCHC